MKAGLAKAQERCCRGAGSKQKMQQVYEVQAGLGDLREYIHSNEKIHLEVDRKRRSIKQLWRRFDRFPCRMEESPVRALSREAPS